MQVTIWGGTGSLPAALHAEGVRRKLFRALQAARGQDLSSDAAVDRFIDALPFAVRGTYGGNTSCVQIMDSDEYVLLDCGSGIRDFSEHYLQAGKKKSTFHIFLSHLHWDHLHGFPFFRPAFMKGNRINIYGCHPALEQAFRTQMTTPFFPVEFDYMQGDIAFHVLQPERDYQVAGFTVSAIEQDHPGVSYGYLFRKDGKRIGYSTDSERRERPNYEESPLSDFFRNCDLLIFDAQYSLIDSIDSKESWGHSSNMVGVELAMQTGVKHLCLFHNEPTADDDMLEKTLQDSRKYASMYDNTYDLQITLAYDGLEIEV